MKYTQPVYRPPYEANTLLLQVTVGCAHNKCTYCTMYKDVQFSVESLDQIEKDLQEAKQLYKTVKRIFLVNGDAFVLPFKILKPIAELIIKYLPDIEVITMYASVDNVKRKSDEELKELAKLRIGDLWMGMETGHTETLEYFNKGFSLQDSYEQLERLNMAGISYLFGFMFGSAGAGKGIENAIATAKLINATRPSGIVPTTLGAYGDSQMSIDVINGKFTPATELEVLEEQKKLIELIDFETNYLGIHGLNTINFDAKLPQEKEMAINKINHAIEKLSKDYLQSIPRRASV